MLAAKQNSNEEEIKTAAEIWKTANSKIWDFSWAETLKWLADREEDQTNLKRLESLLGGF